MEKILFALLLIFTVSNKEIHAGGTVTSKPLDIEEISHIFNTVKKGELDQVLPLIHNRTRANATIPQGLTILQFAVTLGLNEIARFLIQKGADVTAQNYLGNTALHYAVKTQSRNPSEDTIRQRVDIIHQLIQAGASIHAENILGQSPFCLVTSQVLRDILEENHNSQPIRSSSESRKK